MAVQDKNIAHPNPILKAGFFGKVFFWWLKDIIWHGYTRNLLAKGLYDTVPDDLSESLTYALEKAWTDEVNGARTKNRKPSLWKVFTKIYFYDFVKITTLPICHTAIQTIQPFLLNLMISYFQPNSNVSPLWAYFNATVFIFLMVLPSVLLCNGFFHFNRLGMRARVGCTSLIYKKMLRLPSSTNRTRENSIISLLTIDVAQFGVLFSYVPFIIIVPGQLIIVTALIWQYVGPMATTIGLGLLILQTLPIQVIYSKVALKFRAKQATKTDNRVLLIGQVISGMKTIKMFVWETYLEKLVYSARDLEIANYMKILYLSSVVWSITAIAHRPSAFMVTLVCVLRDGTISANVILPVTQYLFNMRKSIGAYFFMAVRSITDVRVSMKRIEEFLLLEEVNSNIKSIEGSAEELISLENVTASWNKTSDLFTNFTLHFSPKKSYAVIGSVGSGKSSIFKLVLGELHPLSGNVFVRGRISYASQEPWLFNSSVKENILFGEKYDEKRYAKVTEACALTEDFSQMSNGDETLVGDRGSNLSGGQCARVNLARAVYRDADTYLFDDPLSAVDAQVTNKIINECINGLLLDKTRILVTHNIKQLNGIQEVILLEQGKVKFKGNMEVFQQSEAYNYQSTFQEEDIPMETVKKLQTNEFSTDDAKIITNHRKKSGETKELIPKEIVKIPVYLSYIKAGGWTALCLVITSNVVFTMAVSFFDFGLGAWTNDGNTFVKNQTDSNITESDKGTSERNFSFINKTILTFGSLILLIIFSSILRTFSAYRFALSASKNIHNCTFSRLMRTAVQFFERNSTGKVLNRFSEDTAIIDNALPQTLSETVNVIFHLIGVLLPAIVATWWISIPCSITTIASVLIGRVYVKIIQKSKRLVGSARSPTLSFAASSLAGVTTIRACKAENIVLKDFNIYQDRLTAAQFLTIALTQAFCLWIELTNIGFLATVTYGYVFLKNDTSNENYVELTLMQILNVTVMMSFLVKQFAEVLGHMTSVERMLQFAELEQETIIEDEPCFDLSSSWPDKGEIIFKHLYLRYSDDSDPVLRDINCKVVPGLKVGIVGRTGAGKSSLISALFRFVKFDGLLTIDGVDIKMVELYWLRSKISIIPQEPVLFKSTLRQNLDPSDRFDDSTLWAALDNVELKNIFNSLEFPIERNGNNLSMGQRQLLCLARAIINRNKILILDEATSNIDSATDALIQSTIKNKFKNCTVLTIVHRLDTVMDSDKILVLDNGRIIEYDHPFVLLQKIDSHFSKMVQEMGDSTRQHLISIAKQAHNKSITDNKSVE